MPICTGKSWQGLLTWDMGARPTRSLPVDTQIKALDEVKVKEDGSYLVRGGTVEGIAGDSCDWCWEGAKVEKVGAVRLAMRQVAIGETRLGNCNHDLSRKTCFSQRMAWLAEVGLWNMNASLTG